MQEESAEENVDNGEDSGAYFTVDPEKYIEIETKVIGEKGRVHIDPKYAGMVSWTFMTREKEYPGTIRYKCDLVHLPINEWKEVTQSRGQNAGQPLTIYPNGDLTAPYKKGYLFKVFVKKER